MVLQTSLSNMGQAILHLQATGIVISNYVILAVPELQDTFGKIKVVLFNENHAKIGFFCIWNIGKKCKVNLNKQMTLNVYQFLLILNTVANDYCLHQKSKEGPNGCMEIELQPVTVHISGENRGLLLE